jgi:excisionase family DNA binding protein
MLSVDDVADYLKIPESTQYKMCLDREIASAKIGKHWRFDRKSVEKWFVEKCRIRI